MAVSRRQKNFAISELVAQQLDDLVAKWNGRNMGVRHGEVVSGALIAYYEMDQEQQLNMIQRARNYDLEHWREQERKSLMGDMTDSLDRSEKPARRGRPRASGSGGTR